MDEYCLNPVWFDDTRVLSIHHGYMREFFF